MSMGRAVVANGHIIMLSPWDEAPAGSHEHLGGRFDGRA
jgi:hypothetical protein